MAPDGNLPESYDAKKHVEALELRIDELNEKLIEQDHRFWHSVFVLVKKLYSKDKSHLGAAAKAVAQNLIPNGRTIVLISGGSLIGVFTLYLMFLNNQLVAKQNYHLQQQNYLNTKANIEQQLIESKRILYEEKEITDVEGNKQIVSAHRPETRKEAFNFYLEARKTQDSLVAPIEPEETTFLLSLIGLFTSKKVIDRNFEKIEKRIYIDLRSAYLNNIDFTSELINVGITQGNILKNDFSDNFRFNLSEASLQETNLAGANLQEANLLRANLERAVLIRANLYNSNFIYANLQSAHLIGANLKEADLAGVNLQNASLQSANLQDADLRHANLKKVRLFNTILTNVNINEADFESADLSGCLEFSKAINVHLAKNLLINCSDLIERSKIRAKLHAQRRDSESLFENIHINSYRVLQEINR